MERLTRLFLLACLCLATTPVDAQQMAQDTYLLAGDVQPPAVHPYPAGTQMTVQRLLADAQHSGVQGTATVLRGQPLAVAVTELCPPTAATSGALLPGDIVIFRALQGWNGPQNVVRVSATSVDIHNLTSRIQAGQLALGNEVPMSVFRTEFGRSTKLNLTTGDAIQHGDVVILGGQPVSTTPVPAAVPAPAGGLDVSPASSPVTLEGSNFLTIPGMSTAPGEVQSVSAPAEASVGTPFDVSPFDLEPPANAAESPVATIPVEQPDETIASLTEPEPAEQGTSNAESLWNALFVLGIVLALGLITIGWVKTQQEQRLEQEAATRLNDSLSTSPLQIDSQPALSATDSEAALSIAHGQSLADLTAVEGRPAGAGFELSAFIPQPDVEPATPTTATQDAQVDEDCPVLSAGIEQSQSEVAEDSLQVANGAEEHKPETDSPAADSPAADSPAALPAEAFIAMHAPSKVTPQPQPASQLVAPTEWFGEDWRKPIVEEPIVEEPVVEEPEKTIAETIDRSNAEAVADTADVNALTPDEASAPVVAPASAATAAQAVPEAMPAEDDDIDDTEIEVLRQRQAAPPAEVLASFPQPEVPGYSEPQPVSQERQDVEDLIENRIPVNLQQASLPLNVSLYGKPSGPKRLRIDAAHTEIAPPHMMSRARRGRRPAQTVASGSTTAPTTKPADSSETAGLDKALNYIDEQLDK